MWRRTLAVFLALAGAGTAAADTIDVNVNNHVVEGRYSMPAGTGQVGVGGLHHDVTNDWLLHAGFLGRGEARTSMGRSEIGLGGRAYGGSVGPNSVLALALGPISRCTRRISPSAWAPISTMRPTCSRAATPSGLWTRAFASSSRSSSPPGSCTSAFARSAPHSRTATR